MNSFLTAVVGISLLLLMLTSVWRATTSRNWRSILVDFVVLVLVVGFLHYLFDFPFPRQSVVAKGLSEDLKLPVALFLSMLLGMLAQFLYRHFDRPKKERKDFDWGLFLAPVFASPIVFIPLMVAFQNAELDLQKSAVPRLMILFVAFQNGFFWKEHFDDKRREIGAAGKATAFHSSISKSPS